MRELKLIPKPREYQFLKKEVRLSSDWKIYLATQTDEDMFAAELLAMEARGCFGWDMSVASSEPEKNAIVIRSCAPQGGGDNLFDAQGYFLSVEPERIIIEAPSAAGKFYGVQTLRQIFRNAVGSTIPCIKIKDWPELAWRGVSDDISRGQVSMVDDFKSIIRDLAFYKKNLYLPYIEDMFAFDIHPMIGRNRGAISKKEMAEIVAEAKKHHVVITPVFESLGHQDRMLSLPENRKYAEILNPAEAPWSFSPVNKEAYKFVTGLISEMAAAVPSPFFHIGGDESFDVGKGTSAGRVKKIGVGRVHAEYFSRLNDFIEQKLNRRMLVYADMVLNHPEALEAMPKSCIMVDWQYFQTNTDFPSIKVLKDAGFKNIMASPGIWSWATYYPNCSAAFTNIANFSAMAKKEKLMGSIASSWGDGGSENLRENNMLAYAYSAAAEWEEEAPDADRFLHRFASLHLGDDSDAAAAALKNLGWFEEYLNETYFGRLFHRTPRIRIQDAGWLERAEQLKEKMREALTHLEKRRSAFRFNGDWADVLEHVARRSIYLADRDRLLDWIARQIGDRKSGDLSQGIQNEIIKELEGLRDELSSLMGDFQRLWLRRNKYPKLDYNMQRLGNQLGALQSFIASAKAGQLTARKPVSAVWFWSPEPNPQEQAAAATHYFMRMVNLDKTPKEAFVKCWADDKATVYINGQKVIEISAYNPILMDFNRPQTVRVKDIFRKGKNYIAIKGENESGGPAGILFEAAIIDADGKSLILTGDEEWQTTQEPGDKWKTRAMKGSGAQNVMLLGTGFIKPWSYVDW
ncbi:MAG TPA: glycoside hydrolase family 20 zincin-like fold domain-containing protein [Candidatus Sumerlaeota bacterium]|nr:MAG: Beta-hexosaminidase [candidate division BRC1 bacterium ADurb.Bin183]HOE63375.1 glycoside hydrolase family 20 zincin-like fold domain-containing protein [Candidatus Sumerlaeota bacterium]HRR31785.1 glycoside hydrolase family 20 zincin-like fold domain-containing protein [Candidatus Sumerlaeia bacterium]HON50670.1 glycoside hydrolase family 20 zincin-like fold domain-containing protein [Candidatus Sumerlaeota bacterium]HOR65212.1 glycoside hydrolase family 20 zincin-like fold domain-conta